MFHIVETMRNDTSVIFATTELTFSIKYKVFLVFHLNLVRIIQDSRIISMIGEEGFDSGMWFDTFH